MDSNHLSPLRKGVVGVQFLFVAFGATVLVPLLVGLDPSTALFTAGIGTLLFHLVTKGKVPIFLGSSFAFIAPIIKATELYGLAGTLSGMVGVAMVYFVMSALVKWQGIRLIERLFPPVVIGPVIILIGLSLAGTGVNMAKENWTLALLSLFTAVIVSIRAKGLLKLIPIFCGIIVGYIAAFVMSLVLPTTGITADGAEYTKAWVLNWDKVAQASWISIPEFLPVKPVFDARAIAPILIMFIVTAVETVGDISGVIEGGMNREATDKELSGGVICDGIGSSFAALFGILPNTSFSQNVGLVTMTKVVNRTALATGAVFLILCGLVPKLGAIVSIMPQAVLGGAAVMMFSSIVISGIQLVTKEKMTAKNLTIVSVALGVGYGMGANTAILAQTPQAIQLIFGGSGIVPAAMVAILLNIVLPNDKK